MKHQLVICNPKFYPSMTIAVVPSIECPLIPEATQRARRARCGTGWVVMGWVRVVTGAGRSLDCGCTSPPPTRAPPPSPSTPSAVGWGRGCRRARKASPVPTRATDLVSVSASLDPDSSKPPSPFRQVPPIPHLPPPPSPN